MTTRREFLQECSAAVATFAVVPWGSVGGLAMTEAGFTSLDQISYAQFAAHINTPFLVSLPLRCVVELRLLKAVVLPASPAIPGRRPPGDCGYEKFSLVFSGPVRTVLESAIHQFQHQALGRFEMYVGRIGLPRAKEVRYEAAFNRPPSYPKATTVLT